MNKFIKCLSAILCGVGALFAVSKVNAYTTIEKYGYSAIRSDNLINYKNINGSAFTDLGNNSFTINWRGAVSTITLPYNSFEENTQYSFTLTSVNGAKYWAYNLFWNYTDNTSENFTNDQGLDYGTYSFTSSANKTISSITWTINFEADFNDLMFNKGQPKTYEPYGEFIDINAYEKVISGYLTTASNIYWSNTWANESYITSYPMYVNESVLTDNYDAPSLIDSINNSQLVLGDFQPWLPSGITASRRVLNGAGFGSCTYLFEDLSSINLVSFTTFQYSENASFLNSSAFYFEYEYNNNIGSVNLTYQDLITKYNFNYDANNLFEHSFYQLIVDNLGYEPIIIPTITRFSYSYDGLSDKYGFGYFNMLNVNGYSQGYESGYATASSDKQKVIDRLQNSYNSLQDAYNNLNTRFESLQELYDSYINDNITLDTLIWNIATTPFETFKTIWDVDILGVNLGSLCVGLMFVGIALYIWRKFV